MSSIDHVAQRQQEYQTQYDQLTARIEAVQKDLGRALESERKLILEQQLQDLTADREHVVEQMTFLEQHAEDIRAGKIELPGLPELEPAPGQSPYKGLQYFDVADAAGFFGREALAAELVSYLREHSLLAVVGASGSGKSSLVRAGLIPALQQNQPLTDGTRPPAGSDRWLVHIITPTAKPLDSLAASLTRDSESVTASATLIDDLGKDPRSLSLYTRRLLSQPGAGDRLLLVVDQFEELFTLCKDKTQRKAFVDALLTAACPGESAPCAPAQSVVSVVWTLRADFYAHCAEFENLRAALQDYQRYIGAMSEQELRRVIEEPAKRGGWELEPGLVEMLLQDVGDEPGALPLLSHALLETWKRRRGRTMTLAGYAASGRVQGAIAKTADEVYGHELAPEQQAIARNIFLRLTELGEGSQDTRRRVMLSDLIPQDQSAEAVQGVLQKLANARLVTTSEGQAEVAHEALIREWPALRAWLEEDREALRVQRRLGEAAHEWETNSQDESYLHRGARLVEAGEWNKTHAGDLNQLEAAFLTASLDLRKREADERDRQQREKLQAAEALAEEQKQRADEQVAAAIGMRRRALLAVVIGILAVLAAIAAGIGWLRAQEQTQLAKDRIEIARMLLGVQRDFVAQVDTGGVSVEMLKAQRQRLEQGETVLAGGVAPKAALTETLTGEHYVIALQRLGEACEPQPCLRSQVRWEMNDETVGGLVLRSEPPASAELLWGTAVTLTVSQGKSFILENPLRMEFVPVPAGEFSMGSDSSNDPFADDDEKPQHPVDLPEFYIGKYEVTNVQYDACVKAEKCEPNEEWEHLKRFLSILTELDLSQHDHRPIANVSWDQAVAFTEWLSAETGQAFRLPTEAEWEKACRGTTGLIYPWRSRDIGPEKLNYAYNVGDTMSVGSYSPAGDSPYGAADMVGNVMEWTSSQRKDYPYHPTDPLESLRGKFYETRGVLRGGSFRDGPSRVRCAVRNEYYPESRDGYVGFRVGFTPPSPSGF